MAGGMFTFDINPKQYGFSNPIKDVEAGYDFGQGVRKDETLAEVGRRLASGDRKGAENAAYTGGQLDTGWKVNQQGAELDQREVDKAMRITKALGNLAMMADGKPESGHWDAAMKMFEAKGMKIPDAYRDPVNGPRMALAEANGAKELLERAKTKADISQTRQQTLASIGGEARAAELHPFKILEADATIENKRVGGDAPMHIKEWRQYQQMTPEQQNQYLLMKRAAEKPLDTGTAFVRPDARNPNIPPAQIIQKDVAGKEFEQEVGTAAGKANAALPAILSASRRMNESLDAVLNDPNLDRVTGLVGGRIPKQMQTPSMAETQSRLEQIQGQSFLQAYNELRGAGAITEKEGEKAEASYSRLRTQTMGTAAYRAAARELKSEVAKLEAIARNRSARPAGPTPAAPATTTAPAAGEWSIKRID